MAEIFNERRVRGVVIVPEGTTMYNNRPVIGIAEAGDGVLFADNRRVLGIDVLDFGPMHNEQPVVGAVIIQDGRTLYNNRLVLPVKTLSDAVITAPAKIGLVTATPGDGMVELAWTAPADGGSAITDYVVQYKLSSSGIWLTFADGASSTPSAVVTGLINASAYDFRVAAVNAIGTGLPSDPVSETPQAGAVIPAANIYNPTAKQFEITNASAYPGAVYVWKDELGNVIAGQAGSTMPESAQPDGRYVQAIPDGVTAAASNFAISAVVLSGFVDEIDAPDGTLLTDAVTGWSSLISWSGAAVPSSDVMVVQGGRIRQNKVRPDTSQIWRKTGIPTGDKIITLENAFDLTQAGVDNQAKYGRSFYVEWDGVNDYVLLFTGAGHLKIDKKIAGALTTIAIAADNLNVFFGKVTLRTKRVGDRLRVYADGVELPRSVALGGYDISGAKKTTGIAWGPQDNQGTWAYPVSHFDRLTVTGVLAQEFNVVSKTVSGPDGTFPAGSLSLVGTCTPGITNYDWSISDANGAQLTPWVSGVAVSSDGNWSILTDLDPKVAGTAGSLLRMRVSGTPGMMTTYDLGGIAAYEPIAPASFGINSGGSPSYASSDIVRDRAKVARYWIEDSIGGKPRIDRSETYMPELYNADGVLIALPAGYDCATLLLFEGSKPGIREGVWNVAVNVPCTITASALTNLAASNVTSTGLKLTSSPAALGGKYNATVQFKNFTFPVDGSGLQVSCLLQGDGGVAGDLVTPGLAAIWHKDLFGGHLTWRDMKDTNGEQTGPSAAFAGSKEYICDVTKKLGAGVHDSLPYLDVANGLETIVRARYEHFRDNAAPGSILAGEVGNEVWNFGTYGNQLLHAAAGGATHGFFPGVTVPEGVVVTNEAYRDKQNMQGGVTGGGSTAGVPFPGITRRIFQPGEYFMCSGSNYQNLFVRCRASAPVPIGAEIWETSTADFEVLGVFEGIMKSARREQAYQQKRMCQLGRSILGNRFKSVLGCWLTESAASVAEYLLFNDAYKFIDHYSPSFYAGNQTDYTDPTMVWATKYASDFAAFKTGFYLRRRASTNAMVTRLVNMKHGVRTLLRQAGVPDAECPSMDYLYEGGDHGTVGGITDAVFPPADNNAFVNAVANCLKSQAEFDEVEYELSELKTKVGGTFEWFNDVEYPTRNTNVFQWFGMRQIQFDGALNSNGADEKRYLAARSVFGGGV